MRLFLYYIILMVVLPCVQGAAQSSDWHTTNLSEAWHSCLPAPNPNGSRNGGHWIYYDFGQVYRLTTTHFWNLNVPERVNSYDNQAWSLTRVKGKPEDGLKEVVLDYSFDGKNWTEWGKFELPKAPASPFYDGVAGPDLGGLQTRYLMLTAISNHGGSCYGLSEVRFDVQEAPSSVLTVSDQRLQLGVQPNPMQTESVVTLHGFPSGDAKLRLLNVHGEVLSEQAVVIAGEHTELVWSPGSFPSGIYVLQVVHPRSTASAKIEIIR